MKLQSTSSGSNEISGQIFIRLDTAEKESTPIKEDKFQVGNSNRLSFHKFHSRRVSHNICEFEILNEESTKGEVEEQINF